MVQAHERFTIRAEGVDSFHHVLVLLEEVERGQVLWAEYPVAIEQRAFTDSPILGVVWNYSRRIMLSRVDVAFDGVSV